MPVIFSIIGKVLVLVDALLNYFVVQGVGASTVTTGSCGTSCAIIAFNYEMTTCGTGILNRVICLVDALLNLAPGLLGTLFAY
jgi:hypothetical protein